MKKYRVTTRLLIVAIATTPITAFSLPIKHFGKGAPFVINDLPDGSMKSKLQELSETTKKKSLTWLHTFSFTEKDLDFLQIDKQGGVLYSDTFVLPKKKIQATRASIPVAEAISAVDAFALHSKPSATNKIYLDFNGHVITSTAWNSGAQSTYSARAYDTDGNASSFSATELSAIQEIWHRIAEDYAPFNVDVTTQEPASFGPTVGRILITKTVDNNGNAMPYSSAGGVAYVGKWGANDYASYYSPALVYYDNFSGDSTYIAEAASHEMGHNLSLSHDGTSSTGYYGGHGSGLISWGPIMGAGYDRNVTQWSKGEYPDANNTAQDDLSEISSRLTYRTDDHSNVQSGATALVIDGAGGIKVTNPENDPTNIDSSNKGIIEKTNDVDYFKFDTGAGALHITINPAWEAFYRTAKRGANLDIQATLYDQNGIQIVQVDPLTDTNALISTTVAAGTYYLAVTGVGNTTPIPGTAISYYSNYGSLGQYFISGTVPPTTTPVTDTTAPTPNPMTWLSAPNANGSTSSIAMQATVATDNSGGAVQYLFSCVSGGAGCVDSNWQTSNQYTATGLATATTYTFQVKAKDATGNQTAVSVSASAKTASANTGLQPPAAPTNLTGVRLSKNLFLFPVQLKWDRVSNATRYDIWRCTEQTVNGVMACNYGNSRLASTSATFYTLGVSVAKVHFKIQAYNTKGLSTFSNEIIL